LPISPQLLAVGNIKGGRLAFCGIFLGGRSAASYYLTANAADSPKFDV
jgi:hypothetical protein